MWTRAISSRASTRTSSGRCCRTRGPGAGNYFDLVFQKAKVALYYTSDAAYNPGVCASGPLAMEGCGVSVNIPTMTITAVPEPSTYALLLAGLGAIGWLAKRRRAA